MTIDSIEIIKTMLGNNGTFPGDPQCYSIHSYMNDWGGDAFHISMSENDELAMLLSPYVHNPLLLWNRDGISEVGTAILEG